ncbi:MAG: tetratricopeptide repeat protein, partial [Cyanobacteria bacterium]|nr:tetratricopeptide repeat protein [Cyanobacteriota bacterium]
LSYTPITDVGLDGLPKSVIELHMGNTKVKSLAWVSRLPHLRLLDVSKTEIDNDSLANLSNSKSLRYLVLEDTKIGLAGLRHLRSINCLEAIQVRKCPNLSRDEVVKFAMKEMPYCTIKPYYSPSVRNKMDAGATLMHDQKFNAALACYRSCLNELEPLQLPITAECLNRVAQCEVMLNRNQEAFRHLCQAEKIATKHQDEENLVFALHLKTFLIPLESKSALIDTIRRAHNTFKHVTFEDNPLRISANLSMAAKLHALGLHTAAAEYIEEGGEFMPNNKQKQDQLCLLGHVYQAAKQLEKSRNAFKRSMALAAEDSGKDSPQYLLALISLGLLEFQNGDRTRGVNILEKAEQKVVRSNAPDLTHVRYRLYMYNTLCANYTAEKDFQRALQEAKRSFELAKQYPIRREIRDSGMVLSALLKAVGKNDESLAVDKELANFFNKSKAGKKTR